MNERLRGLFVDAHALMFWPLLRLLFRASVHGPRLRTRPPGGLIIAPNHVSWFDPLLVQYACYPHRVTFLMTELYYDVPGVGWYFRAMGTPVVREDGPSVGAMKAARNALRAGEVVCLFPEGQLTPNGSLQPGMRGVARLARRTNSPVLPLGIRGAEHVLSKIQTTPRRHPISLHLGRIMHFDETPDRAGDYRFTDRLMHTLAGLTGQDALTAAAAPTNPEKPSPAHKDPTQEDPTSKSRV